MFAPKGYAHNSTMGRTKSVLKEPSLIFQHCTSANINYYKNGWKFTKKKKYIKKLEITANEKRMYIEKKHMHWLCKIILHRRSITIMFFIFTIPLHLTSLSWYMTGTIDPFLLVVSVKLIYTNSACPYHLDLLLSSSLISSSIAFYMSISHDFFSHIITSLYFNFSFISSPHT
jgi:hypothetical protein